MSNNTTEFFKSLKPEAKQIFNLIQKTGYMAKADISIATNFKLTTLNYIMQPLEEQKIIVQKCIGESTGGRKPILYDINLCNYYIIGIDISENYTQIVFTNLKMEPLCSETFPMDSSCTPVKTIDKIISVINKSYDDLNLEYIKLFGVGLAVTGNLDRESGIISDVTNFPAPDWSNVPIKAMLEEKLNCPVFIENGSNSAILAEYFYGIGKDFSNVAYFNCGYGIRTGTISSGKLIRTVSDEEDAFSHMIIDIDGKKCTCGNYGCIQCYASVNAIVGNYHSALKKGKKTGINKQLEDIDFNDICAAAEKNDTLAIEIITEAATIFGIALANYISLINPDSIILNGILIMHSKLFYDECINAALKKLNSHKIKKVFFSRGGYFKENVISIGAAALVIERYLENEV